MTALETLTTESVYTGFLSCGLIAGLLVHAIAAFRRRKARPICKPEIIPVDAKSVAPEDSFDARMTKYIPAQPVIRVRRTTRPRRAS